MPIIKVLPKSISELINAGEVVDRPASIIKELVENSLDADATKITVEIRHGGITYIQVKDDGVGIYKEELPTAFIRHATSKIATAEDLENIGTMGFRGEALPSVCAVSKVTLASKPEDQDEGWQYATETGELSLHAMNKGTVITVRDLFYNTPARMKFLKKDITEGNAVTTLLERLSLSNPHVAFTFIRDGKVRIKTFGDGSLLTAVRSVLTSDVAKALKEVDSERSGIHVTGLISMPPMSRQSRSLETFFINGRFVHSKTCQAAVEEAYKNRLMIGKFPACFLNLQMDFGLVDVNIHPAKLEVRFQNERDVYNAVYSAVLETLEKDFKEKNLSPVQRLNPFSLNDFDYRKEQVSMSRPVESERKVESKEDAFTFRDTTTISPRGEIVYNPNFKLKEATLDIEVEDSFAPVKKEEKPVIVENLPEEENEPEVYEGEVAEVSTEIKNRVENFESHEEIPMPSEEDAPPEEEEYIHEEIPQEEPKKEAIQYAVEEEAPTISEVEPYKIIGEVFKTYILIEQGNNFILIDKHAAHEGYIYHSIKDSFRLKNFSSQLTLIPTAVVLGAEEYFALSENLEVLDNFGIKAEDYGNNTIVVKEIPQILEGCNMNTILSDIAVGVLKGKENPTPYYFDRLIYSVSCRSATMAGKASNMPEMEKLAEMVFKKGICFCPHGRPVKIVISKEKLDKMFGRLV